jgi:Heterokaryon incompatibility protein (HET)
LQLEILVILWADAICINQDDIDERSFQVAVMGRIFADSKNATVWLGKDQSHLEDFAWFHETLFSALDGQFIQGGGRSYFLSIVEAANLGRDTTARRRRFVLSYEQRR